MTGTRYNEAHDLENTVCMAHANRLSYVLRGSEVYAILNFTGRKKDSSTAVFIVLRAKRLT